MGLQFPIENRISGNEEDVFPRTFEEDNIPDLLQKFQGFKTVNIIPEDNRNSVKPASWAYGDHVLEDLMFGKTFMKCIILPDSFYSEKKEVMNTDKEAGICGVCIDHGGDNYIAFPLLQLDENDLECFKMCSNSNFQNYLSH